VRRLLLPLSLNGDRLADLSRYDSTSPCDSDPVGRRDSTEVALPGISALFFTKPGLFLF